MIECGVSYKMTWTWKHIKELNKVLCELSNNKEDFYGIRDDGFEAIFNHHNENQSLSEIPKLVAEHHPFFSCNKRMAIVLSTSNVLENL